MSFGWFDGISEPCFNFVTLDYRQCFLQSRHLKRRIYYFWRLQCFYLLVHLLQELLQLRTVFLHRLYLLRIWHVIQLRFQHRVAKDVNRRNFCQHFRSNCFFNPLVDVLTLSKFMLLRRQVTILTVEKVFLSWEKEVVQESILLIVPLTIRGYKETGKCHTYCDKRESRLDYLT